MTPELYWGAVVLVVAAALLMLRGLLGRLLRLGVRCCGALAVLSVLQPLGAALGVSLGVNGFNMLVLALLGAPGLGLLMMLQWALRM